MRAVSSREVHKLLQKKGNLAWVDLTLRYGKTFRSNGVVLTCDPEAVRLLLMDKTHTEVRSNVHKLLARFPGANGILFMDGEPWLKRVKAVMPAFHRSHVDGFATSLQQLTLRHAQKWERRGRMADLFSAVQQLGVASVLRMGYGLDPENQLAAELGDALIQYKQTTMRMDPRRRLDDFGGGMLWKAPWILKCILDFRKNMLRVQALVGKLLADQNVERKEWGWFAQLPAAGLDAGEIALEMNHLYGAFNAIDYIVTAALFELSRRPELIFEIRKELASVDRDGAPPSREDLLRMPVLNGFILEILRLYPVSMGISRRTGGAITIGGEKVSAGTEVAILLQPLHMHPDFWDRPQELLPERWSGSAEPKVPFSFMPFLDGARKCIGRSMAEMQLQVVLSTLVKRYDMNVVAGGAIAPFMVPRFAEPLPFEIRPRAEA